MTAHAPPPLPTLPLQLMLTMGCWLSSPFALPCAKNGSLPLSSPGAPPSEPLRKAIAEEAKNRAGSLLSGILRYMETPYRRNVAEPPCIWQRGNMRLLDYGLHSAMDADMPIVLFIPSLINRYYILDLEEERSMLRFIASQGVYPLVIDWGEPGEFEKSFGCGDYITQILNEAIDFLAKSSNHPIVLAGYCMGGILALASAQLKRKQVSGIALLATPWDFHCEAFSPFVLDKHWLPMADSLIAAQQNLPADMIQSLFYLTDLWVFEQKFRRFAGLQPDSRAAKDFIALEHWVNDGVPMTAEVGRDCLLGWAQENQLAQGAWKVAGKAIHPRSLNMPTFIAIPRNDHVVPYDCAQALAECIPDAEIINPSAGHVGMIVGSRAKKELWMPFVEWLTALSY